MMLWLIFEDPMTFPILKTGAVAQYPLERTVRFSTEAVRFLDGTQQRFRMYGNGLRRWVVKLDLLDEQELDAVISFVDQQEGSSFDFRDPVTGGTAAKCVISGESFEATLRGEMNGQATLSIEEIP
jgi:hypothetical protein